MSVGGLSHASPLEVNCRWLRFWWVSTQNVRSNDQWLLNKKPTCQEMVLWENTRYCFEFYFMFFTHRTDFLAKLLIYPARGSTVLAQVAQATLEFICFAQVSSGVTISPICQVGFGSSASGHIDIGFLSFNVRNSSQFWILIFFISSSGAAHLIIQNSTDV